MICFGVTSYLLREANNQRNKLTEELNKARHDLETANTHLTRIEDTLVKLEK